jgi:DNA primase
VRADDLEHPDELRVDLDPVPGVPWPQVREVALLAREVLREHGLTGWPKTSGSRGMHINVRIQPRWTFQEVRAAALALARDVERRAPALATSKWWKEERHGVFLDYNQNAKDRTVASAYSVRPTKDARVSTPLSWEEVPLVEPEAFTLATVPERFARIGDPHDPGLWSRFWSCRRARKAKGRARPRGPRTTPSRTTSRPGYSRRSAASRDLSIVDLRAPWNPRRQSGRCPARIV